MNSRTESPRPAVFLDRDGTIIHDVGYLRDPEQVELLPGAAAALRELQQHGLALVVISNQSGVGRGFLSAEDLEMVHRRLEEVLAQHRIELCGAYHCPHAPWDACTCRKPLPGMILRAADECGLDLARSFMVGDKPRDVAAGRRAGCRTVLLAGEGAAGSEAGEPGDRSGLRAGDPSDVAGQHGARGAGETAPGLSSSRSGEDAPACGVGAVAGAPPWRAPEEGAPAASPDEIPDALAADWGVAVRWILAVHRGAGGGARLPSAGALSRQTKTEKEQDA